MNVRRTVFAPLMAACLVACGSGVPSTSPANASDPTSWSRHDLGVTGPRIHAVVAGGPGYIGVGAGFPGDDAGSAIYTSADALTWTVVDEPRQGRSLGAVVAGGPGFVAVSSSPPSIWTSADGVAWREAASAAEFGETALTALVAANGRLFAGAHDGLFTSTNGSDWERSELGGEAGTVMGVAAGGPGYVAVGSSLVGSMESKGAVWTSADGLVWQRAPDAAVFTRAGLHAVGADDGLLVATGYTSDAPGEGNLFFRPSAWTSRDGTTWERAEVLDTALPAGGAATGALEGALMMSLARTEGGWLSAGTALTAGNETMTLDAAIWASDDGLSWQRVPHGPGLTAGQASAMEFGAFSITESNGRAMVVGRTTGPQTTLWLNPAVADGVDATPSDAGG